MRDDKDGLKRQIADLVRQIVDRVNQQTASQRQNAGGDIIGSPQIINLGTLIFGHDPSVEDLKQLIAQLNKLVQQNSQPSREELIAMLQQNSIGQPDSDPPPPAPASATPDIAGDCDSLRRQRDSIKETLEIIAEQKTKYASPTDISPQLEKDEKHWQRELATVERKIKERCGGNPASPPPASPPPAAPPPAAPPPAPDLPPPQSAWEWLKNYMGFTRISQGNYSDIFLTHADAMPSGEQAYFFVDEFLYKCTSYSGHTPKPEPIKLDWLISSRRMHGVIFAATGRGKTMYAKALARRVHSDKQSHIHRISKIRLERNDDWEKQITRDIKDDLEIKGGRHQFSQRFFNDLGKKGLNRIIIIADPFSETEKYLSFHNNLLQKLLSTCQGQEQKIQSFFFLPEDCKEHLERFLSTNEHFDRYCIQPDFKHILSRRLSYWLGSGNMLPSIDNESTVDAIKKIFGNDTAKSLAEIATAHDGTPRSIRKMLALTKDIIERHVRDLGKKPKEDWSAPIPFDTVKRVCDE